MIPWWVAVTAAAILFLFGVFIGYAIAAYQDLRRIEHDLDEMESRQKRRGWR